MEKKKLIPIIVGGIIVILIIALAVILIPFEKKPTEEGMKKAIFWLGQSRDPRAKQALLEIISGE